MFNQKVFVDWLRRFFNRYTSAKGRRTVNHDSDDQSLLSSREHIAMPFWLGWQSFPARHLESHFSSKTVVWLVLSFAHDNATREPNNVLILKKKTSWRQFLNQALLVSFGSNLILNYIIYIKLSNVNHLKNRSKGCSTMLALSRCPMTLSGRSRCSVSTLTNNSWRLTDEFTKVAFCIEISTMQNFVISILRIRNTQVNDH